MPAKRVPVSSIPEVAEFEEVREKIEEFKQQHAAVFDHFSAMASEYNAKLEQAEKVVRAKGVSCGQFDGYQDNSQYDADKLYELVGKEEFLKLGGKLETVTQYKIDRVRLRSMIDAGKLPQPVVDEVYKAGYKYKKPDVIKV